MTTVISGTNLTTTDYDVSPPADTAVSAAYSVTVSANKETLVKSPLSKTFITQYGFRPYTNRTVSGTKYKEQIGRYRKSTRINSPKCWIHSDRDTFLQGFSFGNLPTYSQTNTRRNQLLTTAYAEAKEQAMDVSTNLGELPEAIRLLATAKRRLLSSVQGTVKEYVRRNKGKGSFWILKNISSDISSFWLEYRYGWRPLVSTAEQLGRSIAKVRMGDRVMCVGRQSFLATAANPSFTFTSTFSGSPGLLPSTAVVRNTTITDRASVAMLMSPVDSAFSGTTLVALWELTTLSFVVDWFFNVGDFLSALSVDTQVPCDITMSTSYDVRTKATITGTWGASPPTLTPWVCECEKFLYARTVQSSFQPTITFKSDGLTVPRGIDAAALVIQMAKKFL